MRIPVQEKISELESRIAVLESRVAGLQSRQGIHTVITTENMSAEKSKAFHAHWREMWNKFDEIMKSVFDRT